MASAAVEFYFHEAFRHMDLDAVEKEMLDSVECVSLRWWME